jgi:hypothetical protein
MAEITVRVLDESEWRLYRDLRLRALEESPESFSAQLADESTMTSSSGVVGWTGTTSFSPNATGARKGSQVWTIRR